MKFLTSFRFPPLYKFLRYLRDPNELWDDNSLARNEAIRVYRDTLRKILFVLYDILRLVEILQSMNKFSAFLNNALVFYDLEKVKRKW